MVPFGILSDLHLHNWQAFSTIASCGTNNRLLGLISEVDRACAELLNAGGNTMYIAGDMFHIRGSVAPSVLNPVRECIKSNIERGITFRAIPGNHDLEGKHSEELGSAVNLLAEDGMTVVHNTHSFDDDKVLMVPWCDSLKELREILDDYHRLSVGNESWTLIIHAPLNGVITGLPDKGLTAEELQAFGFKYVFCGHYHNHKQFDNVYSIGALAHHTWSDVNTKAGFLIVSDEGVKWHKSRLPEFVDITSEMDEAEAVLAADGNFVRLHVSDAKMSEIESLRKWMYDSKAKGVVIRAVKSKVQARAGSSMGSISAGASIHQSVSEYVKSEFKQNYEAVDKACQSVLSEASLI